jgi:hypothetical protein
MTPRPHLEGQLQSPDFQEFVSIVDDGRVCYAYFINQGSITGAVWLYNRDAASDVFTRTGDLPPLNPTGYVSAEGSLLPDSINDFSGIFKRREGAVECAIYLHGKILGVVGDGDNPGWAANAIKDGPLALSLL